jgi:hypothetical protein
MFSAEVTDDGRCGLLLLLLLLLLRSNSVATASVFLLRAG